LLGIGGGGCLGQTVLDVVVDDLRETADSFLMVSVFLTSTSSTPVSTR